METLKAPDTTRGDMTRIGKSIVIKGELSCSDNGNKLQAAAPQLPWIHRTLLDTLGEY
jgi:hypothetical protein